MSSAGSSRGRGGIKPWPGSLTVALMWPWSRIFMLIYLIQRTSPRGKFECEGSWLNLIGRSLMHFWRPRWFWSQGSGTPLTPGSAIRNQTLKSSLSDGVFQGEVLYWMLREHPGSSRGRISPHWCRPRVCYHILTSPPLLTLLIRTWTRQGWYTDWWWRWTWTWTPSAQARSHRWPSPTPLGSDSLHLSLPCALLEGWSLIPSPSSPWVRPLTWLTSRRTTGTQRIRLSHFLGPTRPGLGAPQILPLLPLLLLQLPHLHQHQFLFRHPPTPPCRHQTSSYRCCKASTTVYAWWCRVFMTWLSRGPLWAWMPLWLRWPGQESNLLLQGEVRLLQPRSCNKRSRQRLRRHRRTRLSPHRWTPLRRETTLQTPIMLQTWQQRRAPGILGPH